MVGGVWWDGVGWGEGADASPGVAGGSAASAAGLVGVRAGEARADPVAASRLDGADTGQDRPLDAEPRATSGL